MKKNIAFLFLCLLMFGCEAEKSTEISADKIIENGRVLYLKYEQKNILLVLLSGSS